MKEASQQNRTILLCEASSEGIFTAVYEAYERKLNPAVTKLQLKDEDWTELFAEYLSVRTDPVKAEKVNRSLYKRFGETTALGIWTAVYSYDKERADAIYHTIARGLAGAYRGELINYLQDPYVCKVYKLHRNVWNESHRFKGFIRFQELENGVLYAKIAPKNQVLPLIAGHFADRLPMENFMIFDESHNLYLLHEAGKESYMYRGAEEDAVHAAVGEESYSAKEKEMQELFKTFCSAIAIESRKNLKLQKNLLPLRFRGNMIESLRK